MEDFIAYFIIAVVVLIMARNLYKKIKSDDAGCGGGCSNCNVKNTSCNEIDPFVINPHERD